MRRWWRHQFGWRWFRGNYATWSEARAASAGYDDAAVLDRMLGAARAVRSGRVAWDRDGATFAEPAVHAPLLAALRTVAAAQGGRLELVDFGGALGSTWWQYRPSLAGLATVRWRVVEQPHVAAAGRREFADTVLSFHDSLDDALAGAAPAAILLSSVLPYVEAPHALVADVLRRGFKHLIIDRTAFVTKGSERLAIQRVPPALGGGSYPCWLFERRSLLAPVEQGYRLAAEWPGFDDFGPGVAFRGFLYERKGP
ncbi:MAG: methyltransferase, TIGR04325 family [Opitutaceae bacterium]